jgi:hypothetical protein
MKGLTAADRRSSEEERGGTEKYTAVTTGKELTTREGVTTRQGVNHSVK